MNFSGLLKLLNRNTLESLRQRSTEWFQKRVGQLTGYNRLPTSDEDNGTNILKTSGNRGKGNLIMFYYDPKHKDTLPMYDRFPLVIPLGPAKGGFLGLNLHYVQDPKLRLQFLFNLTGIDKRDIPPNFRLNVNFNSNDPIMKLCVKHYLRGHIRSSFIRIPVDEWENVVPLETAQWVYKHRR
tara:strand:- start:5840 stop:6385 length:546 start_codon:yes stop_codon:yes gene_type:complete